MFFRGFRGFDSLSLLPVRYFTGMARLFRKELNSMQNGKKYINELKSLFAR